MTVMYMYKHFIRFVTSIWFIKLWVCCCPWRKRMVLVVHLVELRSVWWRMQTKDY